MKLKEITLSNQKVNDILKDEIERKKLSMKINKNHIVNDQIEEKKTI
jgi:hypothetical protein